MATCDARVTADSSAAQLYMGTEPCWGVDPTTVSPGIALTAVRFTGESLIARNDFTESAEVRSDAQISDRVRVGVGAEGDINFELSYGTFDRFFEGMMRNDWSSEVDVNVGSPVTGTVTIGSPLNQISVAASPNPLAGVQVGAWVRVSGSAVSPSNNGYYRVTANSGGDLTVTPNFAQAESGTNLQIRTSHIRNSTVKKSFLIEKQFTDLSPIEVFYYTGMRVGGASFELTPGEILTGTLSFLGKRGFAANASVGLGAASEAPSGDVANAVDNVSNIQLDGSALDADLSALSFEVNNNTRNKPALGVLGNVDIGLGRFNVTGNITMYFSSRVLYDKFLAATAHSFSFVIEVDGDAYLMHFPSIKFTNGAILSEGNDQDVVANMDFGARRDPTLGFTLGISRFSSAESEDLT